MRSYAGGVSIFESLASWPVDNVSAAVLVGGEQVAVHGDPDRVYELASVTKPLSAYGVLMAVEEGALELDTPAGPTGATVRHLLAHTAGYAFDTDQIQAEPGDRRIYSNTGFEELDRVVARETGMAFADYLAEGVFAPLSMTATELRGGAGHAARSTVADLTRFAAELLRPALLHPDTVTEAQTVQFPGLIGVVPGYGMHRPNDWGLGFEIRGEKTPHWTGATNSARTFGHFGQAGTFLWVDPQIDAAAVVLTDRPFGAWAKPVWPEFSDAVVAAVRAGGPW